MINGHNLERVGGTKLNSFDLTSAIGGLIVRFSTFPWRWQISIIPSSFCNNHCLWCYSLPDILISFLTSLFWHWEPWGVYKVMIILDEEAGPTSDWNVWHSFACPEVGPEANSRVLSTHSFPSSEVSRWFAFMFIAKCNPSLILEQNTRYFWHACDMDDQDYLQ